MENSNETNVVIEFKKRIDIIKTSFAQIQKDVDDLSKFTLENSKDFNYNDMINCLKQLVPLESVIKKLYTNLSTNVSYIDTKAKLMEQLDPSLLSKAKVAASDYLSNIANFFDPDKKSKPSTN